MQAVTAAEAEGTAGEQQEMGISKKEPLVRIQELLGQGNGSLAQGLCLLASQKGPAMLHHPAASDVAVEIARGGEHGEALLPLFSTMELSLPAQLPPSAMLPLPADSSATLQLHALSTHAAACCC